MEHNSRYDRMEEFVDVCKALWSSVEPDAFVWDRETGVVCDPDKVHPINHSGQFFKVRGPLSTVPSPQGAPVLIQAGGSPRGIRASAHFADHIFAASPPRAAKIRHRKALDEALVAEGRDPESVGILFSTNFIVGQTESEAQAKKEALLDLLPEEGVGAYLSHNIGYDFSTLPEKFYPAEVAAEIAASQASPISFVSKLAEELGERHHDPRGVLQARRAGRDRL